jgi:hypothetical protein
MVQMNQYSKKVFKNYLKVHATTKIDTREKFLKLQATYLVMLRREHEPHADEKMLRQFRTDTEEALLKEDKEFERIKEEVELEHERRAESIDSDRRRALYEALVKKVASEAATKSDK